MSGIEAQILAWLTEISHHPEYLYCAVIALLVASSFGLPFPEELVLITSGVTANIAILEAQTTGQPSTLNPILLATACFLAVFLSDLLVFTLGRKFGVSLLQVGPLKRFFTSANLSKVQGWTQKFGFLACGIFRFTPGLRFPGHFMCGAMKISFPTFIAVDGTAALLSVPTQVLLLAYYGDEILGGIKQFKIGLIGVAIAAFLLWLLFCRRKPLPLEDRDTGTSGTAA